MKSIRVEQPEKIAAAVSEAFLYDVPVLLDVVVDPDCIAPLPFMGKLELDV